MVLEFLRTPESWKERLRDAESRSGAAAIELLRELADFQLDPLQIGKLDRALQSALLDRDARATLPAVRLAVVGSATVSHLAAAIRVASLRRGLIVEVHEGGYGMYLQDLMDAGSGLHAFAPEVLLIALDAHHLADAPGANADHALQTMEQCWALAKKLPGCAVLQQTVLPIFPPVLGNNEHRVRTSPAAIVEEINAGLRARADAAGVSLLALDTFFREDGLRAWYEPALWSKSKHEVHPRASVLYGDQVARVLAALRGLSSKCLVLDLDNTLWGGVVGDDGVAGIVLGQGSAVGEAYVSFQSFCRSLARRGVILAVCSKNDEGTARRPFAEHPEMVLREGDIACFVANWQDKAANLREIAARLNIGLDSLVFVDDNPAERALIRRELPMVEVPELPADAALFAETLAGAGYFEGLRVTAEDQGRSRQYVANAERRGARDQATDLESYLQSLAMKTTIAPFDDLGVARVTQLINKTNQFNLTTRRYGEAEVRATMDDPAAITLQVRLTDRFGDNGMIAVLIARRDGMASARIDTWLMSCRVIGRRVEEACLNALVAACRRRGIERLTGAYRPTEKNGMVRELLPRLGFAAEAEGASGGEECFGLELSTYAMREVPMEVQELRGGELDGTEAPVELLMKTPAAD